VSLNVNEVAYVGTSGGYAESELTYFVQYNNTAGTYAVNLNANDALAVLAAGGLSQAQAYLAFGPAASSSQPSFQSYLVNETDCANGCPTGVGNFTSPAPFPSTTSLEMAANTPYLVQIFVQIDPGPTGIQLGASADATFSTRSPPLCRISPNSSAPLS